MIQQNTPDQEDIRQNKIMFWINWTVSNAFGVAIGWCLGEYFGQLALKSSGEQMGRLATAVVFELSLWLARLLPSQYFGKQHPLKVWDTVIWLSTELGCWIIFSFFESSSTWLTAEEIYITGMGVSFWCLYAVFRLLQTGKKRNPPAWFLKAFIFTLIGFGLANMFVTFVTVTAMSISDYVGKILTPYAGWGTAGLFLGAFFGAVTGLILLKSIDWSIQYRQDVMQG